MGIEGAAIATNIGRGAGVLMQLWILFRGGNVLDIQIATDTAADAKRKKPAAGDMRLLVTRKAGKPFAVLYRPRVKGFAGKPIVLTSPTGSEAFDSIEVVESM